MILLILLLLLLPSLAWAISPDADYAARCAAAGVVRCLPMDNTSVDIVQGSTITPDGGGTYRAGLDTSVKVSGAGSLRFDLPPPTHSGQNIAGQYNQGFGASFGQNSTFYVQGRLRISESMLDNTWDLNSGWKFAEFVRDGSVCGNLALVYKLAHNQPGLAGDYLLGYTECGNRGLYTNNGVPPYLLQQKGSEDGYDCSYGNVNETDCFFFKPNEWYTFYWKVQVGTFGNANSTIEAWVAREGATAWKKWMHLPNFVLNADGAGASATFNTLILTPYMSSLTSTSGTATKWSFMWFDEWIISTQPIALPNADRIAANLPQTLGWHQLSNTAIWNGTPELCACEDGYPTACGASNCQGIYAWTGGIYDPSRAKMRVFGGGHNDYYGNEIYSFDLDQNPPRASRLTNPSLPVAPGNCSAVTVDCAHDGTNGSMVTNGDGSTPNARHTYDAVEYYRATDQKIVIGGSLASSAGLGGLAEPAGDMWAFSFTSNAWTRLTLDGTGDNPFSYFSGSEVFHLVDFMGYDTVNDTGFYHNRYRLYSFKVSGSSIKFRQISGTTTSLQFSFHGSGAVDSDARRFYILGDGVYGYYDISAVGADGSAPPSPASFNNLSMTLPPSADTSMNNPGLAYWPPLKKMLAWVGNDIVYYELSKNQWQKMTVGKNTSTPPTTAHAGTGFATFGRFQCDEGLGGCVLAHYPSTDLYYIRLSNIGEDSVALPNLPSSISGSSVFSGSAEFH